MSDRPLSAGKAGAFSPKGGGVFASSVRFGPRLPSPLMVGIRAMLGLILMLLALILFGLIAADQQQLDWMAPINEVILYQKLYFFFGRIMVFGVPALCLLSAISLLRNQRHPYPAISYTCFQFFLGMSLIVCGCGIFSTLASENDLPLIKLVNTAGPITVEERIHTAGGAIGTLIVYEDGLDLDSKLGVLGTLITLGVLGVFTLAGFWLVWRRPPSYAQKQSRSSHFLERLIRKSSDDPIADVDSALKGDTLFPKERPLVFEPGPSSIQESSEQELRLPPSRPSKTTQKKSWFVFKTTQSSSSPPSKLSKRSSRDLSRSSVFKPEASLHIDQKTTQMPSMSEDALSLFSIGSVFGRSKRRESPSQLPVPSPEPIREEGTAEANLYQVVKQWVIDSERASIRILRQEFKLSERRARALINQLSEDGVIGEEDNEGCFQILIPRPRRNSSRLWRKRSSSNEAVEPTEEKSSLPPNPPPFRRSEAQTLPVRPKPQYQESSASPSLPLPTRIQQSILNPLRNMHRNPTLPTPSSTSAYTERSDLDRRERPLFQSKPREPSKGASQILPAPPPPIPPRRPDSRSAPRKRRFE